MDKEKNISVYELAKGLSDILIHHNKHEWQKGYYDWPLDIKRLINNNLQQLQAFFVKSNLPSRTKDCILRICQKVNVMQETQQQEFLTHFIKIAGAIKEQIESDKTDSIRKETSSLKIKEVIAEFTFNKAGQGCFYTGKIATSEDSYYEDESNPFTLVYDCGSLTDFKKLKGEIDLFACNSNQHLSLFLLSHLDTDHINGAAYLLGKVGKCKMIVLPYLQPHERLSLYLNSSQKQNKLFAEFIIDPASFFTNRNVENIVFVLPNNTWTDEQPNSNFPGDEPSDVKTLNINNFIYNKINNAEAWGEEAVNLKRSSNISFIHSHSALNIKNVWEFFFYHEKWNKNLEGIDQDKFWSDLSEITETTVSDSITTNQLERILNSPKLNAIRSTYKRRLGPTNETGLIFAHRPVCSELSKASEDIENNTSFTVTDKSNATTLLCGDIDLKQITIPNYLRNLLNTLAIIQIPHHGSNKNWDKNFFTLVKRNDPTFVVNYGTNNPYKHPHKSVIDEIEKAGHRLIHNTEQQSFTYKMKLKLS